MFRKIFVFLVVLCSVNMAAQTAPELTLKQRALRDGQASRLIFPDCAVNCDFDHLLRQSSVIAVGSMRQRGSRLAADENFVFTDYDFTLTGVIKGPVSEGSILRVTVPGGKIKIGDATAEAVVGNFPPLIDGDYVLFLGPSTDPSEVGLYQITFNELGVYRVVDGRLKCHRGAGVDLALCKIPLPDLEAKIRDRLTTLPPSLK